MEMRDKKKYPQNAIAIWSCIFPDFSLVCELCIVGEFFSLSVVYFFKGCYCGSAVGVPSNKRNGTSEMVQAKVPQRAA